MTKCTLPISELNFLPILVKDYLDQLPNLNQLYTFPPDEAGLLQSLASKSKNYNQRAVFSKVVEHNYESVNEWTDLERRHIALLKENAFAITTAHQPNLFLGPLYTLTKAISTIAIATRLNAIQSEHPIVPIFIIGSEDHDKEELLHANLFGQKYEWKTEQKGSVGRMVIDESCEIVLNQFLSKFGDTGNAMRLKEIFLDSYQKGRTLSQGFGDVLRKLLGRYGLIVLDMNIPEVKAEMKAIFTNEIENQFAINTMRETVEFLQKNYSIQAIPTEINLFEYRAGERVKIKNNTNEILEKLNSYPELFSPNVILRPLMQQMIVPSIANIGGAAEVSYWLEMKCIFDAEGIDFPVILLRDIYSPLDDKSWRKWTENGLKESDFFLGIDELKKKIVLSDSNLEDEEKEYKQRLEIIFSELEASISQIDSTLSGTVKAEERQSSQISRIDI